jgi:hypothetical protein
LLAHQPARRRAQPRRVRAIARRFEREHCERGQVGLLTERAVARAQRQQANDGIPTRPERMRRHTAGPQREDRPLEVTRAVQRRGFAAQRVQHGVTFASQGEWVASGGGEADRRPG